MGAGSIALQEFFLDKIYEYGRELRIWIPEEVGKYLAWNMVDHFREGRPRDLSAMMKDLQSRIPKGRLERFDHLKMMGDKIVYFHLVLEVDSCVATIHHARMYYDDAAGIGKKLREPVAPILERIAADLPEYEGILRKFRRVA
ncbi:MAG: hypothetical protein QW165_03560 [Candidatus Woesearchaeota archaeon]